MVVVVGFFLSGIEIAHDHHHSVLRLNANFVAARADVVHHLEVVAGRANILAKGAHGLEVFDARLRNRRLGNLSGRSKETSAIRLRWFGGAAFGLGGARHRNRWSTCGRRRGSLSRAWLRRTSSSI